MPSQVKEISTKPFDDQKPSPYGLIKRLKVFQQEHYTENFIQSIFNSIVAKGSTLVIGGDGRYFSLETVQTILRIGSANGVEKFIVGKDTILSTPAASNVIREYKATGGIVLTASHTPGGPNGDFGIKYNVSNGGPAQDDLRFQIYENTKTITSYKVVDGPTVDLSKIGEYTYGPSMVSVIDPVSDYVQLLGSIFDFSLIKNFLDIHRSDFRVLFDGLNGSTGLYARAILVDSFGLPESSIQNCTPLPDFGGLYPDPNFTYGRTLIDAVDKSGIEFGAASDGDGDKHMIYGKGAFVTPSDSVAIIAHWADTIPYFKKGGLKGLARSMPTSKALDLVAQKKGLECFELPTGWRYFANLLDAGRLSICGEESFGSGSDHIREKDGLWAIVAWLNIIAAANKDSPNKLLGISDLLQEFYSIYGRSFYSRYDYEDVPSDGANALVSHLDKILKSGSLDKTVHISASTSTKFTVLGLHYFEYKDPIDHSISKGHGQVIDFTDGSRVVFRLSSQGTSTVRMYVERYVPADAGSAELGKPVAEGLKDLIEVAIAISKLEEFLGRNKPTVIT